MRKKNRIHFARKPKLDFWGGGCIYTYIKRNPTHNRHPTKIKIRENFKQRKELQLNILTDPPPPSRFDNHLSLEKMRKGMGGGRGGEGMGGKGRIGDGMEERRGA